MRTLYLLRGAPGSGKSTWVKSNNLEPYTISTDQIRLLHASPYLNDDGDYRIPQKNDTKVFKLLFNLIETKMINGEFIVVDATHLGKDCFKKYKPLVEQYKYRIQVIDFTEEVDLATLLNRNNQREEYKKVPEDVIERMFTNSNNFPVPSWITVIKPNEFAGHSAYDIPDLTNSQYENIYHIGDIHGCIDQLNEFFSTVDTSFDSNNLFVFCGDYIDRGPESAKTIELLIKYVDQANFVLLSGNHEKHIGNYLNNVISKLPAEFTSKTLPQLKEIPKKDLNHFFRKLRQCYLYGFHGKIVTVTHGGIPAYTGSQTTFVPTVQFTKGVGKYAVDIDAIWNKQSGTNLIQVHGHRNIYDVKFDKDSRSFNLEGGVEFGGNLKVLKLSRRKGFEMMEFKNNSIQPNHKEEVSADASSLLHTLRGNAYIQEKKFDHISSFNFTREAFDRKVWDDMTVRARGLYINNTNGNIIARSYNKFFNLEENSQVTLTALKDTLEFPVTAYVKENGYLGIIGLDETTDELLITSKSSVTGEFAQFFRDFLTKEGITEDMIKNVLKNQPKPVTLVFEVVDPVFDPHIIDSRPKIVLLDAIYKDLNTFGKVSYDALADISNELQVSLKGKERVFKDWASLVLFIQEVEKATELDDVEGFVFEDMNNFMFKLKTPFYCMWKCIRSLKQQLSKGQELRPVKNPKVQEILDIIVKNKMVDWNILDIQKILYPKPFPKPIA